MRPFLLCLTVLTATAAWPHDYVYSATVIPPDQGATVFRPFDISDEGKVVGETYTSDGQRGFVWHEFDGLTILKGPAGEPAFAVAINRNGDVAGAYVGPNGYRPCLWSNSTLALDLGLPPQAQAALPVGLSDDGTVMGNFELPGGFLRPFRWSAATGMEALPVHPLFDFGRLMGVSPNGQGVGFGLRRSTRAGVAGPFTLDAGIKFLAIAPPFRQMVPMAATVHGDVVGWGVRTGGPQPCHWDTSGGLHTFAVPTGFVGARCLDISGDGTVVGQTESPSVGWVMHHHDLLDLNLLSTPGEPLPFIRTAVGINRDGTIIGEYGGSCAVIRPRVVTWAEGQIVEFTRGRLATGDESALHSVDGEAATFEPEEPGGLGTPAVEFVLEASTTFSSPNRLVFRSVARQDWQWHAKLSVELWDWQAGRYDPIDTIEAYVSFPTQGLHDVVATGILSRYVEPSTKRLRARVRLSPFQTVWPWNVEFEQLSWFVG